MEIDSLHYSRQVTTMAGGALVETALSNRRGQAFSIDAAHAGVSVWNLKNFYCGSEGVDCASNNGNVMSQRLTAPKTGGGSLVLNTAYGYDGVIRLTSAEETNGGTPVWKDLYTYTEGAGAGGQYGNLRVSAAPGGNGGGTPDGLKCGSYDAATNRCNAAGFQYDNGVSGGPGNITAFPDDRTAAYDAENRQKTLTEVTAGVASTWQYFYDGAGRRVKKVGGTRTVVYVYDAMGQLAAEYDSAPPEPAPCTRCYLTVDHLGSTRLITDASGDVKRRYDYLPFGWDINSSYGDRSTVTGYVSSDRTNPKFTGKERDYETGLDLDYFGARYFSGAQGRFTTPDEWQGAPVDAVSVGRVAPPEPLPYADIENPQSLNKYAYVFNNPLRYTDLDGHCAGPSAFLCLAAGKALSDFVLGAYNFKNRLDYLKVMADYATLLYERQLSVCAAGSSECGSAAEAAKRARLAAMDAGKGVIFASLFMPNWITGPPPVNMQDAAISGIQGSVIDSAIRQYEEAQKQEQERKRIEAEKRKDQEKENRKREKERPRRVKPKKGGLDGATEGDMDGN